MDEYGPVENYRLVDVPEPSAGPGEVRIKVEYSGVRWGDVMNRRGTLVRPDPPFIVGLEVAGTVDEIGEGVTGYAVGDRVVSMVDEGGYAEYAVAPQHLLAKIDDDVALDKALAYFLNLRVAYMIVYPWAKVQEGETVLLHAASGGVGFLVLQILKRRFQNVTVIGVCSSEEKAAKLRAAGCDHVINRLTQDYVEEVTRIAGTKATGYSNAAQAGQGVDLSINGVSGPTIEGDMKVIRKRGRWLLFGRQAADRGATIDTHQINYDGITIMPFSIVAWFGQPEWEESLTFLNDWLAHEELNESMTWPLEEAAAAETAIENGKTVGKVVLKVARD
ncbi:hypothetical protein AXK60_13955 [Tsukamurella pseudospumae]|uniref:Enoyl reductase (ER) domain-containing protein n=1 Tax=Tsukamurella pseudospumae TaxID=239498 RepID=A0A137ZXS2_9ACTN|nr:hypothetical protein AXK61_20140 [Tsukamurella pseudospumae]KXP02983.1 hypothetical protein AXK60_13955 [Tsukamurella pseudospumae]